MLYFLYVQVPTMEKIMSGADKHPNDAMNDLLVNGRHKDQANYGDPQDTAMEAEDVEQLEALIGNPTGMVADTPIEAAKEESKKKSDEQLDNILADAEIAEEENYESPTPFSTAPRP